jgi:6-phosphofructokinase
MRIGVLTDGGDVPGLNACTKALVHGGARNVRGKPMFLY